jgi:hypothetical protein
MSSSQPLDTGARSTTWYLLMTYRASEQRVETRWTSASLSFVRTNPNAGLRNRINRVCRRALLLSTLHAHSDVVHPFCQ